MVQAGKGSMEAEVTMDMELDSNPIISMETEDL